MSDITFITAPIGGGKSLYATIQICHELERTERKVVTNVPLDMAELAEYCHKYIKQPVDLRKRVRLLTETEVPRFFRFMPETDLDWHEIPEDMPNRQRDEARAARRKALFAQRQGDGGCLYVLDECHIFFPAREWQRIGTEIEDYMSQLRKLNDDLFLITQHAEKVDKNFRRNSTQWIYVRNMGKSRLLMGVGLPGKFRYSVFPQQPIRNDKPDESGWFRLKDRNYCKLYNTMAGVGLAGRINPETGGKRNHWVRWVVALCAVVAIAWTLPKLSMKGLTAFIGVTTGMGNKTAHQMVDGSGTNKVFRTGVPVSEKKSKTVAVDDEDKPTVVAVSLVPGATFATLSDGTKLRAFTVLPDGRIGLKDGTVYEMNNEYKPAPVVPGNVTPSVTSQQRIGEWLEPPVVENTLIIIGRDNDDHRPRFRGVGGINSARGGFSNGGYSP